MEASCFSGNVSYFNVVYGRSNVFLNFKLRRVKQWFFHLNSIVKESLQCFWHARVLFFGGNIMEIL